MKDGLELVRRDNILKLKNISKVNHCREEQKQTIARFTGKGEKCLLLCRYVDAQ